MGYYICSPMPYLTQDIVGTSSRRTYGKKGDLVKIYSDHDNVKIVENPDGFRFAVNEKFLSNKKIEKENVPTKVPANSRRVSR